MDLYILCRKRMLVWFYRQRQRKMFIHSGCQEKWGTNIIALATSIGLVSNEPWQKSEIFFNKLCKHANEEEKREWRIKFEKYLCQTQVGINDRRHCLFF